jgi:hypothetical protein
VLEPASGELSRRRLLARAQRRLHARWRALALERRKPAGVGAVACARELATFLWEAAVIE